MKKTKKNVVRYFNEIKMNVCDTVPRCILHFFITQFVDDFEHALEQEDLVEFLKEKQEIRNRRIQFRAESAALEEALPRTDDVVQMCCAYRTDRVKVRCRSFNTNSVTMAEGRVPFCYLCVMFCPFENKVGHSFKNKIIFQSSRGRAEN